MHVILAVCSIRMFQFNVSSCTNSDNAIENSIAQSWWQTYSIMIKLQINRVTV